MSNPKAINDINITTVDTVAHVNDTDNLVIQTTINNVRKVRRASPRKLFDNMLAQVGMGIDEDGYLCAVVDE